MKVKDILFSPLREWVEKKIRRGGLLRRVFLRFLGDNYGTMWDLRARDMKSAMRVILRVSDEELFDLEGERTAGELRNFSGPADIVLDVGCGIGRIEKFLAEYVKEIHAVDASAHMIKLARARLGELKNVFLYRNNGRDLSLFPDEKFDFVFSVLTLQHIDKEDCVRYLMEFRRVTKKGGRIYVQFPSLLEEKNIRVFLENARRGVKGGSVVRFYSPDELKIILAKLGFGILHFDSRPDIVVLAERQNGVVGIAASTSS